MPRECEGTLHCVMKWQANAAAVAVYTFSKSEPFENAAPTPPSDFDPSVKIRTASVSFIQSGPSSTRLTWREWRKCEGSVNEGEVDRELLAVLPLARVYRLLLVRGEKFIGLVRVFSSFLLMGRDIRQLTHSNSRTAS
ncbi:hypothetical protein AVEN_2170-1 [Araneus ventricosus]|uniref:Uncharacterized protein n=1 Tax=Araneus ventricosus TaxID=182803 RepID=A0A4Y2II50_ARAVE|nr:hypothetical protein AVEN_2170-1 [Araneus ventricosus]